MTCASCGGPLTVSSGQTVLLPSATITFDGGEVVEERMDPHAGWCGDCVERWERSVTRE